MFFEHQVIDTFLEPHEIQELMSSLFEPGSDEGSKQGPGGSIDSSSMDEERKRKRKISNRESARRSRWRKKRLLEDLTSQVDRLEKENQELKNRLRFALNQCHAVQTENERLRSESVALWARFSDLHRIFMLMQRKN